MKRLAAVLCAALTACATTGYTDEQRAQERAIVADLEGRLRTHEIRSQEAFEIAYSDRLAKVIPFNEYHYELFAARMDIARRFDRREITKDEALALIRLKSGELNARIAAARKERQDRGEAMMIMGLSILAGAAAASAPQPMPIAAPFPPSICSSYVNGRYISTRCW